MAGQGSSPAQSQQQPKKDSAPSGPKTDPNVVGRPGSIIWIYLLFAVVVALAAGLGDAQSSTLILRLKEGWAKVMKALGR